MDDVIADRDYREEVVLADGGVVIVEAPLIEEAPAEGKGLIAQLVALVAQGLLWILPRAGRARRRPRSGTKRPTIERVQPI